MTHNRLLVLVFLLMVSPIGFAQSYIFNRISIGEGLLSNNVLSVWQDKTGYLWIGSAAGLQRYDGAAMRTFYSGRVDQILADKSERVWIRSGSRVGVFNLRTSSVNFYSYMGEKEVVGATKIWLRKDGAGTVFLVHTGRNCQFFDEKRKIFSPGSNPFLLPDSLHVTDVVDDLPKKRYWIVARQGLGYWDKELKKYYSASDNRAGDPLLSKLKNGPVITRFYLDRRSRYWMWEGTGKSRFLCYDDRQRQFTGDTTGLNAAGDRGYFEVYGFDSYEDSITVVYGLNYFQAQHGNTFTDLRAPVVNPYGMHFNSVSNVFEDREGILWIASDNGLYYTAGNKRKQTHVVFSHEKLRSSVSSFLEDRRGTLWIGTWGRGIFWLKNGPDGPEAAAAQEINQTGSFSKMVWSLCEDRAGNIWVGCDEGVVIRYTPLTRKAVAFRPKAFRGKAVRQLVCDREGKLWFGLQDGSVYVQDASVPFAELTVRKKLDLGGPVYRMVLLRDRELWTAVTGKGLFVIDASTGTVRRPPTVKGENASLAGGVRDILFVNDTLIMLAGEKLGIVNPKRLQLSFDNRFAGLLKGTSFALQKDKEGNVWVGSSDGLSKVNLKTGRVSVYTQEDGLITVHNNSYVPERSAQLKDGTLVFGGNQHVVVFDPGNYAKSVPPPAVRITGFQLNDQYLPTDSLTGLPRISLPYGYSSFSIAFAAISFAGRGRFSYEYMLEGLDEGWTVVGSPVPVRYNFLPHGNYRFLVRVKNDQGEYAPATTELKLLIKPPFWKTIWFYLLIALLSALILYYFHRLRLQKLLHIEKVRNRLARDLHDDMGSTLSTINILSNMALGQKTLDVVKSKEYLHTISQSTHQMMEAMDDIVWSINPVNDSMAKIVARMKESAAAVLEPQKIDYRFEADGAVMELQLAMEARREIFLLFKEALNNIVKYACCTTVVFSLARKGADLRLTIQDDGIGFNRSTQDSAVRGNGLKNMQTRAANLHGALMIESTPGAGTKITLTMPIA